MSEYLMFTQDICFFFCTYFDTVSLKVKADFMLFPSLFIHLMMTEGMMLMS